MGGSPATAGSRKNPERVGPDGGPGLGFRACSCFGAPYSGGTPKKPFLPARVPWIPHGWPDPPNFKILIWPKITKILPKRLLGACALNRACLEPLGGLNLTLIRWNRNNFRTQHGPVRPNSTRAIGHLFGTQGSLGILLALKRTLNHSRAKRGSFFGCGFELTERN